MRYTKLKVLFLVIGLLLIGVVGNTYAVTVPSEVSGLYNTGVDNDESVLTAGTQDQHYTITSYPSNYTTPPSATVMSPHPNYYSPTEEDKAAWIGPTSSPTNEPPGDYTYTIKFNLTGYDPESATITGDWAIDNWGEIYLNGNLITSRGSETENKQFGSLESFIIDSNFVSGINTLEFVVHNYGNSSSPTGLLVANLTLTANPVPLPGAIWLLGSGVLGISIISIRGLKRKNREYKSDFLLV